MRIEDLFDPLPDRDPPPPPVSVDEAVDRFGFETVYGTLLGMAAAAEEDDQ